MAKSQDFPIIIVFNYIIQVPTLENKFKQKKTISVKKVFLTISIVVITYNCMIIMILNQ